MSKPDTRIVHAGRDPDANFGVVNPPVYHASTVLYRSVAEMENNRKERYEKVYYGRFGTPTSFALESAVAELEGGARGVVASSGLGAIATALSAFLRAGDHLLMVDSVYGPTRLYCDNVLARFGVTTTYYDPGIGAGIADLIRPETRVVFTESPGSLTFEIQDVPAIAAAAHAAGAVVLMDNTWGTPLFFRAFDHGVDVSIHAATKYIVGHSDAMLGVIVTTAETFLPVKDMAVANGQCAGPDDVYLGLRGLRTLGARLRQHQDAGLKVAEWLRARPEVARVLHPALPDDPGHALWRRDFTGACGLFGVVLKPAAKAAVDAMLDGMKLFRMGYSWGGYESLIIPANPGALRTATTWQAEGPLLRLHVGLEDVDDLIADLAAGLERLSRSPS